MSENLMRHLIAFLGTLVCVLVFWAGYVSGQNGIWWSALGLIIIYGVIYKLVEM